MAQSAELEAYRQRLLEVLAALDRAYQQQRAPYLRRLAEIEALRTPQFYVSKTEPHPDVAPFEGPLG